MSLLLSLWLATMTVVPKNTILVKGATPSVSDASVAVPENGAVAGRAYRNAYFGLTYPLPAGWTETPAGPPPSDTGTYVLGEFALIDGPQTKAHVLVTAQDLFFTLQNIASAQGAMLAARRVAESRYPIDSGAAEVTIAGHTFHRLAYSGPRSGLHWRVLSTDTRCHVLTFTFTGSDPAVLDAAEKALSGMTIRDSGPACVQDYARDHAVHKTVPSFPQRYNTIPARLLIDAEGRVAHVHLLSAFPEQSQAIIDSVRDWRFQPYVVDGKAVPVETGVIFGTPRDQISAK